MKKRGQAAMEFLMTYGWAILVVLAAIGTLAYFGVFSLDNFLPDKCVLQAPLSCLEHKLDGANNQVILGIQNNAGVSLDNVTITLSSNDCSDSPQTWNSGGSVNNGARMNDSLLYFSCAGLGSKTKITADLIVEYQRSGQSVSHNTTGSLQGKVE